MKTVHGLHSPCTPSLATDWPVYRMLWPWHISTTTTQISACSATVISNFPCWKTWNWNLPSVPISANTEANTSVRQPFLITVTWLLSLQRKEKRQRSQPKLSTGWTKIRLLISNRGVSTNSTLLPVSLHRKTSTATQRLRVPISRMIKYRHSTMQQ